MVSPAASLPGAVVDALTQQVGVTGVSGVLGERVSAVAHPWCRHTLAREGRPTPAGDCPGGTTRRP